MVPDSFSFDDLKMSIVENVKREMNDPESEKYIEISAGSTVEGSIAIDASKTVNVNLNFNLQISDEAAFALADAIKNQKRGLFVF